MFLSPGVDVAASVEALGRKHGMTADVGKYFSVSLGQGQVRLLEQWNYLLSWLRSCSAKRPLGFVGGRTA